MSDEQVQSPRKTFCWITPDRVCGGDCEGFDPIGAGDQSGTSTGCRLINASQLIAKGAVALGKWITEHRVRPGADIKPPRA